MEGHGIGGDVNVGFAEKVDVGARGLLRSILHHAFHGSVVKTHGQIAIHTGAEFAERRKGRFGRASRRPEWAYCKIRLIRRVTGGPIAVFARLIGCGLW